MVEEPHTRPDRLLDGFPVATAPRAWRAVTVRRRGEMDYRILGPLLVSREREPVTLDGRRNTELLSLLLLHANEVVSSDRLIEDLWPETPPAAPRKAVQVYVTRLRKALGEDVLRDVGRRLRPPRP